MLGIIQTESWVVMIMMMVLVLMSISSWAIIIRNTVMFRALEQSLQVFEKRFWSGVDLQSFSESLKSKQHGLSPVERIFLAGYTGFSEKSSADVTELCKQCSALMDVARKKWEVGTYSQLAWLATIASVSPYVGLLGTVFGVMHTFQGIMSSNTQAQLSAVAPGISEALGMTAFGLFVALPATVGFNRLSLRKDALVEHYGIFQDEFLVLIRKHTGA